jgi:signal transduction histidine kinase
MSIFVQQSPTGDALLRSTVSGRSAAPPARWNVIVKHPSGSLEAFVGSTRRRNLLVSTGILAVLGASMALLIVSTRRSQELARQQLEFVAAVSHELRTPLAVIRANAEYLQLEQPGNAEVADIVAETERLSSLVDALLALAHGDERRLPHEPLDLGELVAEAAASLRTLAADRGVELEIDARPGLEVRGDREQLRQLVVILADNALRYTGAGGRVGVQAGAQGGQAAIEVADTGIGIPPESLRRVFERFYRTDEARNRASGGAGLGLAIVSAIAGAHGGAAGLANRPDGGADVWLVIPACES